ncbi:hypothetical protein [Flavobacterium sp. W22_SRS_FP1]|uniref:hypothetical protein n=1 Tax=Flavobacterium sp. W22_SRS_FP1 TaxID=3240276 RepID=UPI003F8E80E0
MGKKLTPWERRKREEEKEQLAAASRAKTAVRRGEEREKLEKLETLNKKRTSLITELFDDLLLNLSNLTRDGLINNVSAKNQLIFPNTISSNFKYPGDLTYTPLVAAIDSKNFVPNKSLEELNKNKNMSYNSYESNYGSFFGNLFGKTKKEYLVFVDDAAKNFKIVTLKEEKRKEDYKISIAQYKNEIENFNKKASEKLIQDNNNRVKESKNIEFEINDYIEKVRILKNSIDKGFSSVTEDGFESLFGLDLPIKFDSCDNLGTELQKQVKDLNSNFYDSPSNNFKYGISITDGKINLFLVYNEDYFPLPSGQQINSIKSGYSVRALTNANRESVAHNLVPSLSLLYVSYAFNTSNKIKDITVSVGIDAVDGKTGTNIVKWEYSLYIDRGEFAELKFDNIIPGECIKLFKRQEINEISKNIRWFGKEEKLNPFKSKIQELSKFHDKLQLKINHFSKKQFSPPDDIKKVDDAKEIADIINGKKAGTKGKTSVTNVSKNINLKKEISDLEKILKDL